MFTCNQLQTIMPLAGRRAQLFYPSLIMYMSEYEITSLLRMAAFLATVAHESMSLHFMREIWGPESWQLAYEGRIDLGNVQPGDGKRYLGRGLIEITGRGNYQKVQDALGIPCVDHPEMLENPVHGTRASCWWWKEHGCNDLADLPDFRAVTRKVNGGYNGWESRKKFYDLAIEVLNVPDFSNVQAGVQTSGASS